jgi:hypothetical protein
MGLRGLLLRPRVGAGRCGMALRMGGRAEEQRQGSSDCRDGHRHGGEGSGEFIEVAGIALCMESM